MTGTPGGRLGDGGGRGGRDAEGGRGGLAAAGTVFVE